MLRTAALTALAVFILASPAAAAPIPAKPWHEAESRPAVAQALAVARDYWHASPACPDGVVVYIADFDYAAGIAEQPGCRMWLSDRLFMFDWDTPSMVRRERATLCGKVVHEYGHLLGFSHRDDAASIMFPGVLYPRAVKTVPGCRAMMRRPRMVAARGR